MRRLINLKSTGLLFFIYRWVDDNTQVHLLKKSLMENFIFCTVQCPSHIEISQICGGNQLTGFYMRGTLVSKGLKFCLGINIMVVSF